MANALSVSTRSLCSVSIRPLRYFEIRLEEELLRVIEEIALMENMSVKRVLENALDKYCDLELYRATIFVDYTNNQLGLLQRVALFFIRQLRSQKKSRLGDKEIIGLSEDLVRRWQEVVVKKNLDKPTILEQALQKYIKLYSQEG
jgi:predicted transcriptional regulator